MKINLVDEMAADDSPPSGQFVGHRLLSGCGA
jgi:hypothetical protein